MEAIPETEIPKKAKRTRKMTPELLAKLADARIKAAQIKKDMAGNLPAKVEHAKNKIQKERQHSKSHIKKLAEAELDKDDEPVIPKPEVLEKEEVVEEPAEEPPVEEPVQEEARPKTPTPPPSPVPVKKTKKKVIIEEPSSSDEDEEEVVYIKKRLNKKVQQKVQELPVPVTPKYIKGVPPSLMKARTCPESQRRAIFGHR